MQIHSSVATLKNVRLLKLLESCFIKNDKTRNEYWAFKYFVWIMVALGLDLAKSGQKAVYLKPLVDKCLNYNTVYKNGQ